MKKFLLILVMGGIIGYAGTGGIISLDFDVETTTPKRLNRAIEPWNIRPSNIKFITFHFLQLSTQEIKYADPVRDSQNVIQEARFYCNFLTFLTPENPEIRPLHQQHTHDVPGWKHFLYDIVLQPGNLCRLQHPFKLPEKGISGPYILPLFQE